MPEGTYRQPPVDFKLGEHMIDLRDADHVETEIVNLDGKTRFYIHVDGVTVLRIYGVKTLNIKGEAK